MKNKVDWSAYFNDVVLNSRDAPYKKEFDDAMRKALPIERAILFTNQVLSVIGHYPQGIPDLCLIDICNYHFSVMIKTEVHIAINYLTMKELIVAMPYFPKIHPQSQVLFMTVKHLQQKPANDDDCPPTLELPPNSPSPFLNKNIRALNSSSQAAMNWTEFFKMTVKIPQLPLSNTSTLKDIPESRAKEILDIIMSTLQKHPDGIPELCLVAACNQYQKATHEEISLLLKHALGKNLIFILAYFPKIHPQSQYKFVRTDQRSLLAANDNCFLLDNN